MNTTTTLTPASHEAFMAYAKDADNWGGNPLVGGNVGGGREERGNLTDLKRKGLIETFEDDRCTFVHFTQAGRAYAEANGVNTSYWA